MAYGLHREMSLFCVDYPMQHWALCFPSHNLLCHNRTIAALLFNLSKAVQAARNKVSVREGALNGERYESRPFVESAYLRLGAHRPLTRLPSGKQPDRAWTADLRPER